MRREREQAETRIKGEKEEYKLYHRFSHFSSLEHFLRELELMRRFHSFQCCCCCCHAKSPLSSKPESSATRWWELSRDTLESVGKLHARCVCRRVRLCACEENANPRSFPTQNFFLLPLEASHLQFFGCCRSARSIILYVFLDSVKSCGNKIKSRFYFLCSKLRLLRSSHFSTCFVCCNSDTAPCACQRWTDRNSSSLVNSSINGAGAAHKSEWRIKFRKHLRISLGCEKMKRKFSLTSSRCSEKWASSCEREREEESARAATTISQKKQKKKGRTWCVDECSIPFQRRSFHIDFECVRAVGCDRREGWKRASSQKARKGKQKGREEKKKLSERQHPGKSIFSQVLSAIRISRFKSTSRLGVCWRPPLRCVSSEVWIILFLFKWQRERKM